MDPYLLVLIYIIFTLTALVVAMLVIIAIIRLKTSHDERKYGHLAKEWEAFYLDFLLGDSGLEDIPAQLKKEKYVKWYRRFFTPYLETLDGADFEATKALCREIGLIAYYQDLLVIGSLPDRAVAAKFLGLLRCRLSVSDRLEMLESDNELLVLAAAQGLTVSESPDTFEVVLEALLYNTYYTYEGATEILTRYGLEICQPITLILDQYSREPKEAQSSDSRRRVRRVTTASGVDQTVLIIIMIDLLGHYRYHEALPLLKQILKEADAETIIHIFKAFLRIGAAPDYLDLKPYLIHDTWVVRSFAAQVAVLVQDYSILPLLDQLLADSQWWVRYHAALALKSFGEEGYAFLRERAGGFNTAAAAVSSYILDREEVG